MAALLDGVLKAQDEVLTVMFAVLYKKFLMNTFIYFKPLRKLKRDYLNLHNL